MLSEREEGKWQKMLALASKAQASTRKLASSRSCVFVMPSSVFFSYPSPALNGPYNVYGLVCEKCETAKGANVVWIGDKSKPSFFPIL